MGGFVSAMHRSGNGLLLRICAIAAIGGLVFGYDTGVISGYLADAISHKWTTVLAGSVYVIGALGCALSINAPMLIGFRFLLGISVGTASFVAPLYISEVAPPKVRGGLVSFNQLAATSGILIAYIVNFLLEDVTNNWRWMLGLAALPGAAINTVIYYAPTVLAATGLTNSGSIAQTVVVGITNVVFTVVALLLLDRVARLVAATLLSLGDLITRHSTFFTPLSASGRSSSFWPRFPRPRTAP
ncbi:MAG: MFS transporter [Actinomycetota bacterium]|nr:MFS transporter [Actinomycetota bacterium]